MVNVDSSHPSDTFKIAINPSCSFLSYYIKIQLMIVKCEWKDCFLFLCFFPYRSTGNKNIDNSKPSKTFLLYRVLAERTIYLFQVMYFKSVSCNEQLRRILSFGRKQPKPIWTYLPSTLLDIDFLPFETEKLNAIR